jgi:PAS domain S-box-containing protein
MIDLREAQRIKDLVSENPDQYEEIIEGSTLAICVTDETGTFIGMNSKYLKLYGYEREEMIGQGFVMVLEPDKRNRLQELHDLFMKLKDEIMRNWEVMRKDGGLMTITADAGYEGNLMGHEAKITFVWPDDPKLQELIS